MDWLSHHLEQDLDGILLTDPMDDLSRLIASPISSSLSEEKASASAGDARVSEVESQETNIPGYVEMTSKHPKSRSWNISFGHSEAKAFSARTATNSKQACVHTPQFEQAHLVESLLNSVEDGLYVQNVSIAQSSQTRKRKQPSQGTQYEQRYTVDGLLDCLVEDFYPSVTSTQWVLPQGSEHLKTGLAISRLSVETPSAKKHHLGSAYGGGTAALVGPKMSKNEAHIMAERKRRDKLNQRFGALCAILPGLKKVDKATVLGDAIKYVKQLEEQLKELEEGKVSKGGIPVTRKNSNIVDNEKILGTQQPDIEARLVGKSALIHVHCDNIRSILLKAVEELERLPLSIVNANALSFSNTAVDLTFTAQIEEDTQLTADDIVKALHSFFKDLT